MWVIGFLLVLGPLVTVHELGHYLVGRWFGVKADAFSVGFGKELFGRTDSQGTRWKLSALPLGGYVQFKGDMNPASVPDFDAPAQDGSFQNASLWRRALIVAAGPVTNILVAVLIFAGFAMAYGKAVPVDPASENYVAGFAEISPARDAGVRIDDRIAAIDGKPLAGFRELRLAIAPYPNKDIVLTVERDGQDIDIPVRIGAVVQEDDFGNAGTVGLIGIEGRPTQLSREAVGPVEAVGLGFEDSWNMTKLMVTGIKQILVGDRSVKELGGPIKIAKFSGEQLSLGLPSFVQFAAFISLNLAFINLLPIPALDGGHLAFYAAEAVRRKPVGPRGQELAYKTGIALVLMLMLVVTVNDVASLVFTG